jgi:ABC-2 type transport system permease protein
VSTQQQAMFVTFFIMLIYLLMSGLFTPVRSMANWAQWIAHVNPLMYFIGIMRSVLLKGAEARDLLKPLAALGAIGAVVLSLAIRQYGRRMA